MPTDDIDYGWENFTFPPPNRPSRKKRKQDDGKSPEPIFNPKSGRGVIHLWEPKQRKPKKPRKRRPRVWHVEALKPRYRERIIPLKKNFVGRETIIGSDGHVYEDISYFVPDRPILRGGLIMEKCWDHIHPGPPFRTGGPFRRLWVRSPWQFVQGHCHVDDGPFGTVRSYDGGFVPSYMGPDMIDDIDVNNMGTDLSERINRDFGDPTPYGAGAWNRFKPKLQAFDGPVALYEFKDIPEMLRATGEGFHETWKALGGHPTLFKPDHVAEQFLNIEFGWKPFLSDLDSFNSTYHDYQRLMYYAAANNNKWVRRHGTVLRNDEITSSYTDHELRGANVFPSLDGHLYRTVYDPVADHNMIGQSSYTTRLRKKVWFSGCFRYSVPSLDFVWKDDEHSNYVNTFNRLRQFGVRVSPSLLYKAYPWSWLLDWYTNFGSVLDNFSSMFLDGMISRYAYIMQTIQQDVQHTARIFLRDQDVTCVWYQELESKRREEASPFGFSLRPDDISPEQKLILLSIAATRQ